MELGPITIGLVLALVGAVAAFAFLRTRKSGPSQAPATAGNSAASPTPTAPAKPDPAADKAAPSTDADAEERTDPHLRRPPPQINAFTNRVHNTPVRLRVNNTSETPLAVVVDRAPLFKLRGRGSRDTMLSPGFGPIELIEMNSKRVTAITVDPSGSDRIELVVDGARVRSCAGSKGPLAYTATSPKRRSKRRRSRSGSRSGGSATASTSRGVPAGAPSAPTPQEADPPSIPSAVSSTSVTGPQTFDEEASATSPGSATSPASNAGSATTPGRGRSRRRSLKAGSSPRPDRSGALRSAPKGAGTGIRYHQVQILSPGDIEVDVFLDGRLVARVRNEPEISARIPSGRHMLQLKRPDEAQPYARALLKTGVPDDIRLTLDGAGLLSCEGAGGFTRL